MACLRSRLFNAFFLVLSWQKYQRWTKANNLATPIKAHFLEKFFLAISPEWHLFRQTICVGIFVSKETHFYSVIVSYSVSVRLFVQSTWNGQVWTSYSCNNQWLLQMSDWCQLIVNDLAHTVPFGPKLDFT